MSKKMRPNIPKSSSNMHKHRFSKIEFGYDPSMISIRNPNSALGFTDLTNSIEDDPSRYGTIDYEQIRIRHIPLVQRLEAEKYIRRRNIRNLRLKEISFLPSKQRNFAQHYLLNSHDDQERHESIFSNQK